MGKDVEKRGFIVIGTIAVTSILWFLLQSVGQAVVSFFTMKFLKKHSEKNEKELEPNSD